MSTRQAPYHHRDGSNCWTKNCSLEHVGISDQFFKSGDISAFLDAKTLEEKSVKNPFLPETKSFRSLEYGSENYKLFIQQSEELQSQVSGAEYQALSEYTGWAFKQFYGYLENQNRDGSEFGSQYDDETKAKLKNALASGVKNLDSFVAKAGTLPKPVQVFRGESLPAGTDLDATLAQRYPVGKTVNMKRFLSTSLDPKVASEITGDKKESYVLVIKTKTGAMLGGDISEQGLREKEVILPRDRKYRVEKITTDTIQWGTTKKTHKTVHLTMVD
jgi:hypothetical protein